jgi:RND family efflux transporter MFP subunit
MSEENKNENVNKSSKAGAFFGWLFTAAICVAAGWISCELWPRKVVMPPAPPAVVSSVAYTNVVEREYNLPSKYIAHAEPVQEVELLPQVDGYIEEIKFKEGDIVKAGDVLYIIDNDRYMAIVNQRKADLAAAEAESRRAARYNERMKKADSRGVTELERDNAEAAAASAAAAVLQAKANLVVAEYDLKKAKIIAPISGQIGKTSAHVGDYVSPSKGVLARIVQIDPMRVSFPLTDRSYVMWRRSQLDGTEKPRRMRLLLPDGSEYKEQGEWAFDDNEMSKDTATIMMRLSFPNKNRLLIPNSYVTLLVDFKTPPKYPSIPQQAIVDTPGGNVGVYVLKDDNTVEIRNVKTLEMFEGWVPITEGLKVGEKVIIAGTRKLVNGMKVVFATPTSNEDLDPKFQQRIIEK